MVTKSMSYRSRILAATESPIKNRSLRVVLCDGSTAALYFQIFEFTNHVVPMGRFKSCIVSQQHKSPLVKSPTQLSPLHALRPTPQTGTADTHHAPPSSVADEPPPETKLSLHFPRLSGFTSLCASFQGGAASSTSGRISICGCRTRHQRVLLLYTKTESEDDFDIHNCAFEVAFDQ